MGNAMDNLPSVKQMFKLIVVLILAVIALGLVMAMIKMLIPLAVLAAIVVGVYYLYQKMQANS